MDSSYQALASEYYNVALHPTCANFRNASELSLSGWLARYCSTHSRVLEVGAGRSVVLEWIQHNRVIPSNVVVSDESLGMLQHSRPLVGGYTELVIASAESIPLSDGDRTIVLSSLGDPYNSPRFWREAWRVLRAGGRVLFSTPSHEWARTFRRDTNDNAAEFQLQDGRKIEVPSIIRSVDEQIDMIRAAGFSLLAIHEIMVDEIVGSAVSEKLLLPELRVSPIVRSYLAEPLK